MAGKKATVQKPAPAPVVDPLSLFTNAPSTAPSPASKKSKASNKEEVNFGQRMDCLAALKIMEKIVENEGSLLEAELKQEVIERFATEMVEEGKKPDSFIGTGVVSKAYCEIRKKASNSVLPTEVVESMQKNGIPFDKNVKVPERFVINPEVIANQDFLTRLAQVIKGDPVLSNLKNENGDSIPVVMKQPEEYVYATSESTIDCLAKTGNMQLIKEMLTSVANFAIGKFSINGNAISNKESKSVTPEAKAAALKILQEMEILPAKK